MNITGYSIYYTGDSFESDGRIITVEKISQNSAVISINGIKMLIGVGDKKNENGVDIELMNIFYVSEPEARNVDLSINITGIRCGDEKCEEGENSENCCMDCGCLENYKCKDNKCVYSPPPECRKHEECDDGDPETIDLCVDLHPKICKHYKVGEDEVNYAQEDKEKTKDILEEVEDKPKGFFYQIIIFFKSLFGS